MRRRRRRSTQKTLTELLGIKRKVKKQVGKVHKYSTKKYQRSRKRLKGVMSVRNKKILQYARNGVTERELVEKMGLRPQTARVELKYLKKLGYLR